MQQDFFKICKNGWSIEADRNGIRFAYDRTEAENFQPESTIYFDREMVENIFYKQNFINTLITMGSTGDGFYCLKTVTIGRDVVEEGRLFLVVEMLDNEEYLIGFSAEPSLQGEDCFKLEIDEEILCQFLSIADLICGPEKVNDLYRVVNWGFTGELVLGEYSGFFEEEEAVEEGAVAEDAEDDTEEDDESPPDSVRVPFVLTKESLKIYPEDGNVIQIDSRDVDFWEYIISIVESFEGAQSGSTAGTYNEKGESSSLVYLIDQLDEERKNGYRHPPFYRYRIEVLEEDLFEVNMVCIETNGCRDLTITGSCDFFSAISAITGRLMRDSSAEERLIEDLELVNDDDDDDDDDDVSAN